MRAVLSLLARCDAFLRRWIVGGCPPKLAVWFYSATRRWYGKQLAMLRLPSWTPPPELSVTCWGLRFQLPIFNAAGMFKDGEGYPFAAAQGAGAFLIGSVTPYPRIGNRRDGILQPFLSYPRSQAASNWLGLPNRGYRYALRQLQQYPSVPGCPRGVSIAPAEELQGEQQFKALLQGMEDFTAAGIDFIELNESCPNTEVDRERWAMVWRRLEFVRDKFLCKRKRFVPVVVKFSTDVPMAMVPTIVDRLCQLGFDGVNFGNTSTQYQRYRNRIHTKEQRYYDFFVRNFGGGISGAPLRDTSLLLCMTAVEYLRRHPPSQEFVVIRTGGIMGAEDLKESLQRGIHLCQWYTGYFEQWARAGWSVYASLVRQLVVS